jgi:hypothetical protein
MIPLLESYLVFFLFTLFVARALYPDGVLPRASLLLTRWGVALFLAAVLLVLAEVGLYLRRRRSCARRQRQ